LVETGGLFCSRRGVGFSTWPLRAAQHHDACFSQALDRRAIVSEGGQYFGRVLS
jgi:hypothetical protein